MIRPTTLLVLIFGLFQSVFSQKFSLKYYVAPVLLNPANTGRFLSDYRISGVSRSEANGLSTDMSYYFSLDTRVLKRALVEQDRLAFGVAALSESDRYFGIFNKSIYLSLAYFKGLDEEGLQQLGIGFQTSFTTKSHEPPTYVFPDQVEAASSSGFSGLSYSSIKTTVSYVDFNAGLTYQNRINYNDLFSIGISFLHITSPRKQLDGGKFIIQPEFGFQMGYDVSVGRNNRLTSNLNLNVNKDRKLQNLEVGCIYQLPVGQSLYKLNGGLFYKHDHLYGDALVPTLGMKVTTMTIFLGYDVPLNNQSYSRRTAFDLGVLFTGMSVKKKQTKYII